MSKACIGDRIRIKTWYQMEDEFGLDCDGNIFCNKKFTEDMKHLCGEEGTVMYTLENNILIEFDNKNINTSHFIISNDMLEITKTNKIRLKDYIEQFTNLNDETINEAIKNRIEKYNLKLDTEFLKIKFLKDNVIAYNHDSFFMGDELLPIILEKIGYLQHCEQVLNINNFNLYLFNK